MISWEESIEESLIATYDQSAGSSENAIPSKVIPLSARALRA
jgi:hypothetical protein